MVRLPLISTETLESDADVPDINGITKWSCVSKTHHNKQNRRTRGDVVVGVIALSVDAVDRNTRCG